MSVTSYTFHSLPLKLPNKGMVFPFLPLKPQNKRREEYFKIILFIPFHSLLPNEILLPMFSNLNVGKKKERKKRKKKKEKRKREKVVLRLLSAGPMLLCWISHICTWKCIQWIHRESKSTCIETCSWRSFQEWGWTRSSGNTFPIPPTKIWQTQIFK